MLLIRQYRIYRTDLQANPDILYVFGDNLDREGMGGQAFEMRGEPNAFGVATKRSISHTYPDDYFFDDQKDVIKILNKEFNRLEETLRVKTKYCGYKYPYDAVVVPLDGLGTGLSRMPEFAPKALEYINKRIEDLRRL